MKTQTATNHTSLVKIPLAIGLAGAGFLLAQSKLRSQEVAPLPIPLVASGEYKQTKDPLPVEGAKDQADFAQEAYGKSFSVMAEGLPEGLYSIEIDVTETHLRGAGMRLMRVTVGDVVLADKFDIYLASGGMGKATTIRGKVQHAADAIGGPLTLKFEGLVENAKFNAIRVLNARGQVVAGVRGGDLSDAADAQARAIPTISTPAIYKDPNQPMDARVDDLIRRMSLKEKTGQLGHDAPAISRLGVPAYNYWSEALHGVARAGNATVFPQAIGMAATWDDALVHRIGDAVSTEGRAKYEETVRQDKPKNRSGLTFWSPNINIFRDPRWGRGQETYGEDPFLTARMGVSYITGLQGNNPKYLKAVAGAKHFAVHSGPEKGRFGFNVAPTQRDLYETYLPQFQAAVEEGHVGSVMAAFNAIDGVPAAANHWLLTDLLRDKWGFKGHVVSDCDGVRNLSGALHYASSNADGSAKAIRAGLDLECGGTYSSNLTKSVAQGLVTAKEIDTALHRVLMARFQLGLFDPPQNVPFANVPMSEVESPAHLELARQTVRESIVLLKNNGVLPLDKTKLKKIAVIGFNAKEKLLGNYSGVPSNTITLLQGIKNKVGAAVSVEWRRGAPLAEKPAAAGEKLPAFLRVDAGDFQQAVDVAKNCDVVIYVGGLNANLESEQSGIQATGFSSGDRTAIELPDAQTGLLKALQATGKPVIFVNCSGSAIAMPWEAANLAAIVQAWYPGGEGGAGVADVLFGDFNPAGRLPVTFYEKTADLPAFENYSMANRTYRYFSGKPLFPFGFGLSYTSFDYLQSTVATPKLRAKGTLKLRVPIKNTGGRDGDEVVQVYLHAKNPSVPQPIRSLIAFQRLSIAKGATANINFAIPVSRFQYWSVEKKDYIVAPGDYDIQIGASSADIRKKVTVTVTSS